MRPYPTKYRIEYYCPDKGDWEFYSSHHDLETAKTKSSYLIGHRVDRNFVHYTRVIEQTFDTVYTDQLQGLE